nr:restriction endonuclease [Rubrivivax gelatinosus]
MSAIEAAGYIVLRNRAYTGDGGIAGRVVVPGSLTRTWAVQVKRYGSTVTPSHISDFVNAIREGGHAGGLFVHCGRTGPLAYRGMAGAPIELISGTALLALLHR